MAVAVHFGETDLWGVRRDVTIVASSTDDWIRLTE